MAEKEEEEKESTGESEGLAVAPSDRLVVGLATFGGFGSVVTIVLSIGLNGPYRAEGKCQVIIFVQVLSNLVKVKGIKFTCKVGDLSNFFK